MRILMLSTYPVLNPIHGGQHRLNRIAAMLAADGHQIDVRGILGAPSYLPQSGFLRFPGEAALARYLPEPKLMEDWAVGRFAADQSGGYGQFSRLCDGDYDVVFCEQPWLFDFAHKCFAETSRKRPLLIYGSQNIEHRLKYEIVEQYLGKARAAEYADLVKEIELGAVARSDMLVAVSKPDLEWLTSIAKAPVVLAPNGVIDRRASLKDVEAANRISGHHKFALYCASGHPPNIQGFYDIFGKGIGCLSPTQRLIVAGGAGPSILGDPRAGKTSGLNSKLIVAGEVSESVLRGLLASAHLIVLPITRGGGTNLKTAEAIWSGRRVVATTVAMRGFERYAETARGLAIADEPAAFLAATRDAMAAPSLQLTSDERADRSEVLWDSTLAPLVAAIRDLQA